MTIPQFRVFFLIFATAISVGCQGQNTIEDSQQIRQTVAGISDALSDTDRLEGLFDAEAVPDKNWIKAARGSEFVVSSVDIEGDNANVGITTEDAFGEVVSQHVWKLRRKESTWVIQSCPIE